MADRIPFLLLGDGPAEPTGLGRITRDLASQLVTSDLPLDLVQVGGTSPPVWSAWRHVPLDREEDWGAKNVEAIYRSIWGTMPGILFAVWDPARLYSYLQLDLPVRWWAYCAIDGANLHEQIGGPAGEVLRQFDRVLAYGRYGNRIITNTHQRAGGWLPHGISASTYSTASTPHESAWVASVLGPYAIGKTLLGCVMTNQTRKDFGLLFQIVARLRERGHNLYLWLHTDELVKAWSVQQLVEDTGLAKLVTVSQEDLSDRQMACLYQRCRVTLLPSLGEGHGYPIVESLASGVPVVHSDCAGGAALVPKTEWRVPVHAWRLESVYAINRPVFAVEDWVNAVERAMRWRARLDSYTLTNDSIGPGLVREYCIGSVAHLDWAALWPRWYGWVKAGLS